MIELYQLPWSPYCLVQQQILRFAGVKFRTINIPNGDRSLIWKLTRERYYQVPVLRDGKKVLFETDGDSQVIAKYLDQKYSLSLFPPELEGVQSILWRYIENELEDRAFRLNDVYYREFIPPRERLAHIRHKERKFGRGCLELWKTQQPELLAQLARLLLPFDEMVRHQPYCLGARPSFVDFDLHGILGNLLFTGHYTLPKHLNHLRAWHRRTGAVTRASLNNAKSR